MKQIHKELKDKYPDLIPYENRISEYNEDFITLIENKVKTFTNNLLGTRKRKVLDHIFIQKMIDVIVMGEQRYHDGLELLEFLSISDYKIPYTFFNQHGTFKWVDILHPVLLKNKTFLRLKAEIFNISAKGVGKGEYFLLVMVEDYKLGSGKIDGEAGNIKIQLKDSNGGSCKPDPNPQHRIIDHLNKIMFNGYIPFRKDWFSLLENKKDNIQTLTEYFTKLQPTWEESTISTTVNEMVKNFNNQQLVSDLYSKEVLKAYKRIDEFDCIVLPSIDEITIINDFDNIPSNVKLKPQMRRGGDTQSLADGFVNISIKKSTKKKK